MNRPRIVAALVVLSSLAGLLAITLLLEGGDSVAAALPEPLTTTTEEPNFEALVESEIATVPPVEQDLTDEALARSTSTTTTLATTTTAAPSTTTTEQAPSTTAAQRSTTTTAAPTTTSPPTTSPPTTSPPTTSAGSFVGSAESEFASRINSYRSSNGLPALKRSGSLDSYARNWAKQMGLNGDLSHSNIGSLLSSWNAVGENVGMGGSVSVIFDALKGSSGHADNMKGDWTHMGIGVWQDSSGTLWTCHVFAR